jgi:lysozyme
VHKQLARRLLTASCSVLLIGTLAAAASPDAAQAARPEVGCVQGSAVTGFNVNYLSGFVDWTQVDPCTGFVYVEAAVSATQVDPDFSENQAGAATDGIALGAYDFFHPDEDAATQASEFLSAYTPKPGDLPPALDVEDAGGQTSATIISGIATWVSTVEAATGIVPVIRTTSSLWTGSVANTSQFTADPLWIAEPGATAPTDTPASNWGGKSWTVWQSRVATVAGVSGSNTQLDQLQDAVDLSTIQDPATTSAAVASVTSKPTAGQKVTVKVAVVGGFHGTAVPAPTGTVTVASGSAHCTATVTGTGGAASGSCPLTLTSAGAHSITATYGGDSRWRASAASAAKSVKVGKAKTKTTLTLTHSKLTRGHENKERLSVRVASAHRKPVPTGKVKIKRSGKTVCTIRLKSGKGSCTLNKHTLAAGKYKLVASYPGNASLIKSSSAKKKLTVKS